MPPGTSQARIDALVGELGGQDATSARVSGPPDAPNIRSQPTSAEFVGRIWNETAAALRSVPQLRKTPSLWSAQVGASGDPGAVSARFWLVVAAGLLSAPLIGKLVRLLLDRPAQRISAQGGSRLSIAFLRLGATAASLPLFALLFWIALLAASSGNRMLEETADRLVWAALEWRFAIAALVIVLSPRQADLRLLRIDDAGAARCMGWLGVYATIAPFDYCLIWLVERVGFSHSVVFGAASLLGTATTAYKIAMLWAIRRPIAGAILAATGEQPSPLRRGIAASWHWLFIALALAVMAAAVVAFSFGEGASVYGAGTMTQTIVVAMAIFWLGGQKIVDHRFAGAAADAASSLRHQRFVQALRRLCDALSLILGIAWLAEVWGFDVISPPPGSLARLLLRPALIAAMTVVGAWMLWLILSGLIDEKIRFGAARDDEAAPRLPTASRFTTVLPLIRNLILVGISVVTPLAALMALGVDLAPLLAAFGVIGVALGFGAQGFVRDAIAGMFYLLDDAFRIGEYIQSGNYKGTVESFSIRSVRLRHHRGPVYTVPFSLLGAVENMSRDWVIDKFSIGITYDSDIERARKLIKQIGQELAQVPEFAPFIIEPLKMQGVEQFGDFAVQIRLKMMTVPGEQFVIRRKAFAMIKKAFDENGIKFAFPTVQVAGDGDVPRSVAAAAEQALGMAETSKVA